MLHTTLDGTRGDIVAAIEHNGDCLTHALLFHEPPYIPRLASLAYTSWASFLESGASPMRSKILSGSSPRLYARTTCVCRSVLGVSSFAILVRFFSSANRSWIKRSV